MARLRSGWCKLVLGDGLQVSRPIVWIIGFFAFLNVYSMQAVLPLVMQEFHATPVQAGATVGATVLAIALVSPFMGMLSDALGRRRMVCSCLFALTIPTALIPLVDSLWAMVVLRFCQGLAVPGIVVVLIAYLSEEFRSSAVARMTATYVGGTVMGGFCGRFLTGHAGHVLGWRGAFVTLALLNLLGALLVFYALPASRHFVANRDVPGALRVLGRHLGNRRFLAICAVGFCVLFSLVGSLPMSICTWRSRRFRSARPGWPMCLACICWGRWPRRWRHATPCAMVFCGRCWPACCYRSVVCC